MEADKEPSTYMDAMHIILRHIHGAWPRADERIEMAKEIEALVDKAVVAELERLLPQMGVEEYAIWVRTEIVDRLNQLNGAKDE